MKRAKTEPKVELSAAAAAKSVRWQVASDELDKACTAVAHAAAEMACGATDHAKDVTSIVVDKSDFAELTAKLKVWRDAGNALLAATRELIYAENKAQIAKGEPS